jgi:hypothetical protein
MKQSREEDFARASFLSLLLNVNLVLDINCNIMLFLSCLQRGAFPIYPTKDGLIFVPLSFELPISSQLQEVDMVLHKITDEIVKIDPNCSIDFPKGISFSAGMSEIIR